MNFEIICFGLFFVFVFFVLLLVEYRKVLWVHRWFSWICGFYLFIFQVVDNESDICMIYRTWSLTFIRHKYIKS